MLTIDALKTYGADVEDGLQRCMNNEAFYLRMVTLAAGSEGFGRLFEAISAGDPKTIFEQAHQLKGALANLSLTPILLPVSELTERTRHGEAGDYQCYADQIREKLAQLQEIVGEGA